MSDNFLFLSFDGLDECQAKHLKDLINPTRHSCEIEFPWSVNLSEDAYETVQAQSHGDLIFKQDKQIDTKGSISSLNVHAPEFQSVVSANSSDDSPLVVYRNGQDDVTQTVNDSQYFSTAEDKIAKTNYPNGQLPAYNQCVPFTTQSFNGHVYANQPVSSFKLNPTVSSFIPSNSIQIIPLVNGHSEEDSDDPKLPNYQKITKTDIETSSSGAPVQDNKEPVHIEDVDLQIEEADVLSVEELKTKEVPVRRSWADVVSAGQKDKVVLPKSKYEGKQIEKAPEKDQQPEVSSVDDDKMALALGKHLHGVRLDFQPIFLQPRGLINKRNWCYVHATLQALLACSPFYTLLRNLPLGPCVERGKSSTPVIDSMIKVTYEFPQLGSAQEELTPGQPFQPDFIYDMLRDLKSDCLKGQQEDAEEFLSFILNGMHEEMVKIIKNYEKKNHISMEEECKENGDVSDGEEEWQVINSKHKGMVTRKVAEHKTPISDLLGGQIKSFLTTSGSKPSASIQPFFTLQLDIQSESVNSVADALKEMTVKEPIQGYTCAKTKQEVEAFSHIALQKLPPILILHLKRFVYNINGGCKKVMKKTDYPLELELSKEVFSSDVKKNQRQRQYKLFAVMYHDGEEAIKGHYISDIYNHSSSTWIRCDDRVVTSVTVDQVLSHSPPRVPYLLFYQEKS